MAGNPLDISSGLYMYTAMAKQHYTSLLYKKCTTAEQSCAGKKQNKTKQNLENILNYLKNY